MSKINYENYELKKYAKGLTVYTFHRNEVYSNLRLENKQKPHSW